MRVPEKSWWARLPFGVRMGIGGAATLGFLTAGGYGVAALVDAGPSPAAVADGLPPSVPGGSTPAGSMPGRVVPFDDVLGSPSAIHGEAQGSVPAGSDTPVGAGDADVSSGGGAGADDSDDPTASGGTRAPGRTRPDPAPRPVGTRPATGSPRSSDTPSGGPSTGTYEVSDVQEIPFETRTVEDPSMPRGATRVWTEGEPGVRTRRYAVTTVDGHETGRRLLDDTVTKQPVTQVVAVGTMPDPDDGCSPGYDGCDPGDPSGPGVSCDDGGGGPFVVKGVFRLFWPHAKTPCG